MPLIERRYLCGDETLGNLKDYLKRHGECAHISNDENTLSYSLFATAVVVCIEGEEIEISVASKDSGLAELISDTIKEKVPDLREI